MWLFTRGFMVWKRGGSCSLLWKIKSKSRFQCEVSVTFWQVYIYKHWLRKVLKIYVWVFEFLLVCITLKICEIWFCYAAELCLISFFFRIAPLGPLQLGLDVFRKILPDFSKKKQTWKLYSHNQIQRINSWFEPKLFWVTFSKIFPIQRLKNLYLIGTLIKKWSFSLVSNFENHNKYCRYSSIQILIQNT